MDISFIIILGLPVLYVTGSLKKIVKNAGVGGVAFVLYFVCTAALSFIPVIRLMQFMKINVAGAFFCIAPAVYLAVKRRYTYRYYLAFVLTTLFAVAVSFFTNTYTLPYLPYIVVLVITIAAVICFKRSAPLFAPVMMGVYGIASGFMQLFAGMDDTITLFSSIGMISLCSVLCLFAAYPISRPRGRHAPRRQEA
jgi:hypothetical protein